MSLDEEKSNPWILSVTGKLISPLETSDTGTNTIPKGNTDRPLRDLYEGTSNFRFRPDFRDNPFDQPNRNQVPILSTFPTWESTDDVYYYNILKNKGPAKRKVTFEQTITILPSNLLSEKQLRYQTRY